MNSFKYILSTAILFFFTGCIENDIPYPIIKGLILEIEFEGQESVEIDNDKYEVKVVLNDTTDIQSVVLKNFVITEDATIPNNTLIPPVVLNLEQEHTVVIETYQKYPWSITTTQPIERSASIEGQIGKAIFNEKNHNAIIYVSQKTKLDNITVNSIILAAPENSVTFPDPKTITNFISPVQFTVTQHGRESIWYLHVLPSDLALVTEAPTEVWAKRATLSGSIEVKEGVETGFEYKRSSDSEYTKISGDEIEYNGGSISITIVTEPNTEYVYSVFQGDTKGAEAVFTTEIAPTVPNLSFEDWYFLNDKTWFPCLESEYSAPDTYDAYWNTGNLGVTLFKESNVVPTDDAVEGKAVLLSTIGSVPLVGMAAGSIFTGNFITDMLNPINSTKFGHPFVGRPTKLIGSYKYFPTKITVSDEGKYPKMVQYKGELDRCIIWMNLEDWGGATKRPENPIIVGRGEFKEYGEIAEYKPFEMNIDYKIKDRKPTHIVLVISSSEFGEFYTGGIGTKLYIDEFELVY